MNWLEIPTLKYEFQVYVWVSVYAHCWAKLCFKNNSKCLITIFIWREMKSFTACLTMAIFPWMFAVCFWFNQKLFDIRFSNQSTIDYIHYNRARYRPARIHAICGCHYNFDCIHTKWPNCNRVLLSLSLSTRWQSSHTVCGKRKSCYYLCICQRLGWWTRERESVRTINLENSKGAIH